MDPVFQWVIRVSAEVVDQNGHVNNVAYVQWMQDVAIRHSEATGCSVLTSAMGASWVARTHHVEYLRPAFLGDEIKVLTWVSDFRKVRSLRKYKFVREGSLELLVQAETDWVFVDAKTGRARSVPESIQNAFQIVASEAEP